jgi:hypothetical protein
VATGVTWAQAERTKEAIINIARIVDQYFFMLVSPPMIEFEKLKLDLKYVDHPAGSALTGVNHRIIVQKKRYRLRNDKLYA